jgi:hypothetical protein
VSRGSLPAPVAEEDAHLGEFRCAASVEISVDIEIRYGASIVNAFLSKNDAERFFGVCEPGGADLAG